MVNEFVENVGEKLSSKKLTLDGGVFSFDEKLFVVDLCLRLLPTLIFKKFSDHTSESDKDGMFLRDSHDKTETFEKKDHFKGFLIFFENAY